MGLDLEAADFQQRFDKCGVEMCIFKHNLANDTRAPAEGQTIVLRFPINDLICWSD